MDAEGNGVTETWMDGLSELSEPLPKMTPKMPPMMAMIPAVAPA
jgi:hypothetical protein